MFYRNEIDFAAKSDNRYPWYELEEYLPNGGMWSIPEAATRQRFIKDAELLMANPEQFRLAMHRALDEWPRSVVVALENPAINHKAWIGHAGCYLATGSVEETTRLAWHHLDEREQLEANHAAATVIAQWRKTQNGGRQMGLFDVIPSLRCFQEGADHA